MALVSPGVEVSIIDQSQYLPAASSSVPLLVIATAQNKINAAGTAVAPATTSANANKLYQVTSQRDLVNLYGNPFFYKTTNGTSIHGYELNEYGLMAAYSLLGTTNRAFILRADIDLAGLVGQLARPVGEPADGTYWLDTTNTSWGIYEFAVTGTTGKFTNKAPIVIVDADKISAGYPDDSLGNIGDYAVIARQVTGSSYTAGTYFYKSIDNIWTEVGKSDWKLAVPTIVSAAQGPNLTEGHSFKIRINSGQDFVITVPTQNSVDGLVTEINSKGIAGLQAKNIDNGYLAIYFDDTNYGNSGNRLVISKDLDNISFNESQNTVLAQLGIDLGTHFAPEVSYGTSAQMPLWTPSQSQPHPTGSVWIKTSAAGNGLDLILAKYTATSGSFAAVDVPKYLDDGYATAALDGSGGKSIPAGSVYAQYSNTGDAPNAVLKLWERRATGPTVITGSTTNQTIPAGTVYVRVSIPGVSELSQSYSFAFEGGSVSKFVTSWLGTNIPNTTAIVTTDGGIQITHISGGQIQITDFNQAGVSSGILTGLGIEPDVTPGVKYGKYATLDSFDVPYGSGGATVDVKAVAGIYRIVATTGGTGYDIGEEFTISGSDLGGTTPANDLTITVIAASGGVPTEVAVTEGVAISRQYVSLSNWVELDYIANEGAPAAVPLNGTTWFYSTATQADIMVNKDGQWVGYRTTSYDETGHPRASGSPATNVTGPILSSTAPEGQSDNSALEYGDLWIDTSDLENYPVVSRWQAVDGIDQWVLVDKTDQTSSSGMLFADARWAVSGNVDPVSDPLSSITSLLTSNYLDLDAPDPALYPQGMLLFNTRRSGYNVKEFKTNYFTGANYPNGDLPTFSYAWVSASGLKEDGSAFMGRKAQRNMVVQALKSAIGTNMSIREEDTFFNLIAAPNYPELQPDMVTLNNDRNNTAYIVGDTPLRLKDQATEITAWANNTVGATSSGEDGWVTRDSYLGVFYPSGITTDLTGASIVVPASHMMLRTFLRNDTVAYPWLAAAGTRRGTIDNATNIGYLDAATGEFQTVKNRMSIRDVLYTNQINPLAYFTGVGLLNYGNKNSFDSQSALDRTNVARLIAYIRERVQVAARPFVFEPNDALTRSELQGVIQSLFVDLVSKRGLYDYLVVCDDSNNTAARIDRNELWVDIAIEPVKAAEFIYIPVRILNTGELNA